MHTKVIPDVAPEFDFNRPEECKFVSGVLVTYKGFWFWKKEVKRERIIIAYGYTKDVENNWWLPAYRFHFYPHEHDSVMRKYSHEESTISYS